MKRFFRLMAVLLWLAQGAQANSIDEIRQALENGNMAVANELLGRPYSLTGLVVHGKGIGHTIGMDKGKSKSR